MQRPCEVGSYPANAFGLFDMHGNVWEWCQDWYGPYDATVVKDPPGPASSSVGRRVLRGGSWYYYGGNCRSAYRNRFEPGGRGYNVGFRLVVRTP